MSATQKPQLRVIPQQPKSATPAAVALVDLQKAVKGAAFYPAGHPCRAETVQQAFKALSPLCEEKTLLVSVQRAGFSVAGQTLETNAVTTMLAKECLVRHVRSISFTKELRLEDVASFVGLLSEDPQRVNASGMATAMEQAGIRTIRVNDLEVAQDRRAFGDPEVWEVPEGEEPLSLDEILALMAKEREDGRYQELGRALVVRVRQQEISPALLPVLDSLLAHHLDEGRTLLQREYALFILEHLADGAAEMILDCLESREYLEKEGVHRILKALGGKGAYWIVQRVCLAQGLEERKALAAALVYLGPRAVPPVIAMLKDERWTVVRNMVSIIGELRRPECIPALKQALHHDEGRVRKEAVRALMKCGGAEAEWALVGLLEEKDEGLVRQAIICLGFMRSRQAVQALHKLLEKRELRLQGVSVKKEAVAALGRIGDRRSTGLLLRMLSGWFNFGRREELKIAVAAALGTLGDEAALPILRKHARGGGRLADACGDAVESIERLFGAGHE